MTRSVGAEGRWGGRVTSRELPDGTEELRELSPAVRQRLAQIWWIQAATERRVATSFAIVRDALEALEAGQPLVDLAARAIDDERRHAALCEDMAVRVLGRSVGRSPDLPMQRPEHPAARDERERQALWIVGQCALNETFASAYLSTAHKRCTSQLGRAALHELLKDEIDHSRLGWAYLSTLPRDLRESVSGWLVPLTVANLREWRSVAVSDDVELEPLGVPHRDAVRAALDEVVNGVLLPGFAHVGLDVRALERWVARGAPT